MPNFPVETNLKEQLGQKKKKLPQNKRTICPKIGLRIGLLHPQVLS